MGAVFALVPQPARPEPRVWWLTQGYSVYRADCVAMEDCKVQAQETCDRDSYVSIASDDTRHILYFRCWTKAEVLEKFPNTESVGP